MDRADQSRHRREFGFKPLSNHVGRIGVHPKQKRALDPRTGERDKRTEQWCYGYGFERLNTIDTGLRKNQRCDIPRRVSCS